MASRIAGITIEIGGDTTKLQSALKDVNQTLKHTETSLKDVDKLLKLNPTNTELLSQKQKMLGKEISSTKEKLETLKQAQAQMDAEGVDKTSDAYMALRREIIENEEQLKSLQKEYKNFGSVAGQAVAAIGSKLKDVGKKISDFGKQWSTHVTAPLVALGAAGAASFAEVDKTMQLTNQTMGNTEEEANALNKAMEDAAANSTFGMKEAAQATLNFARAGLDAEQAAYALAPAMNLAAGEGGDLDTVSAGLVATINGFQDSFGKSAEYADIFAAACNNSALDVNSLAESMSVAAPVFKAAGYSVQDAALYMGVMANNGIEASEAANSLKTGLSRLVSPAKEGQEWLNKLGWSILNADGTMKDSITVQKELHDKFAQLSEAEQIAAASAIFGKNQMSKWLALINTAPEDVDKLNNSLNTAAGTTKEMSDAMMSGFGGSIEKLKSSLDVLMTSLGRLLAEYLQPVIEKIQGWIDKFNALDDHTKKIIVTVGLIVAAIGPLLVIIGQVAMGVGALMSLAPLILSPVSAVIAILAALVAAGVLVYKNWDTIKAKAQELGQKISEEFTAFKEKVATTIQNVKDSISTGIENIKTKVKTTVDNMKTSVVNTFTNIKTSVSRIWDNIKTAITKPVQTAWETVTGIVEKIKRMFDFELSFPHIKLPHFSWTWSDLGLIKVPHISVAWYKKAYDQPYLFDRPTVMGNRGFGDGNGAEMVYGRDNLMNDIKEAMASATQPIEITVKSYLDGRLVGQGVTTYQRDLARAMGV